MQPRQQLLDIWKAQVAYSMRLPKGSDELNGRQWFWGGRNDSDAVGDAQQLLCMLLPAQELPELAYSNPDATSEPVLDALKGLGDPVEIPIFVMRLIKDYMTWHTDDEGVPIYSGGANMHRIDRSREATPEQRAVDITEGFALAIPLCIAALVFLTDFGPTADRLGRPGLIEERQRAEDLVHRRLRGALVGLLRSFSVATYDEGDEEGSRLIELINVDGQASRKIIRRFRDKAQEIIGSLRDITIGSGGTAAVEASTKLFEVGWSWSVVEKAPRSRSSPTAPGSDPDAPWTPPTCTSPWWRSRRSRPCSPRAWSAATSSTTRSSSSSRPSNCAWTSPAATGRWSPPSAAARSGRSRTSRGAPPTAWSTTTTASWCARSPPRTSAAGEAATTT
ncbi:hypothetical protein GCM10029992_65470 [Glycomyces albus]